MNPLYLIVIAIGLIMIYVGWKGSQHSLVAAFMGIGGQANTNVGTAKGVSTQTPLSASQPSQPGSRRAGNPVGISTTTIQRVTGG